MDTEFDVLAEGGVELVELFTVFGDLVEELEGLLDNILLNHLHDLVLLESLTREVERQVFRINHTLNEAEPLRNEVSGIISNEDTTDVKFDIVLRLLGLKEIEGSTLGDKKDCAELELTFDRKVLYREVILPVAALT